MWLTVAQAAEQLSKGHSYIEKMIKRKEDPMPFRLLDGTERGQLINERDFDEWVYRNSTQVNKETPDVRCI